MTTKPDLTRIWAEGAPAANIEDPDVTSPGKFNAGWLAEIPPFENFNYLQQLFTQALAHANEYGIMQWDAATPYPDGAWARSTVDDEVYVLKVGGDPSNEPSVSPADWETIKDSFNIPVFGTAAEKDIGTASGELPIYTSGGVDGLGYGAASTTPAGSIDEIVKTGFHTTAATTTGTFPAGSSKLGVISTVKRESTYVSQIFHDTSLDKIYTRVITNGTPATWKRLNGTAAEKDIGTASGELPIYTSGGLDGLGYGGMSIAPVGSIDALVITGFYTTAASTAGSFPSGGSKIGVLTVVTRSSTYVSQQFHDTMLDKVYTRVIVNGTPLPWTDLNPIKAWVQFNGTGTVSINASKGVSSITDRGVGLYTVNLSSAMPSNNYATFGFANRGGAGVSAVVMGDTSVSRTVTAVPIQVRAVDNTAQDAGEISIQIVGV